MKFLGIAILVAAILLSGCVGVDGKPLVIPDGHEIYGGGFVDGCMSILLIEHYPDLPPYQEALNLCYETLRAAREGVLGTMPSEMSAPVPAPEPQFECKGNCL